MSVRFGPSLNGSKNWNKFDSGGHRMRGRIFLFGLFVLAGQDLVGELDRIDNPGPSTRSEIGILLNQIRGYVNSLGGATPISVGRSLAAVVQRIPESVMLPLSNIRYIPEGDVASSVSSALSPSQEEQLFAHFDEVFATQNVKWEKNKTFVLIDYAQSGESLYGAAAYLKKYFALRDIHATVKTLLVTPNDRKGFKAYDEDYLEEYRRKHDRRKKLLFDRVMFLGGDFPYLTKFLAYGHLKNLASPIGTWSVKRGDPPGTSSSIDPDDMRAFNIWMDGETEYFEQAKMRVYNWHRENDIPYEQRMCGSYFQKLLPRSEFSLPALPGE